MSGGPLQASKGRTAGGHPEHVPSRRPSRFAISNESTLGNTIPSTSTQQKMKILSRHRTPPWLSQSPVVLNRPHFHPGLTDKNLSLGAAAQGVPLSVGARTHSSPPPGLSTPQPPCATQGVVLCCQIWSEGETALLPCRRVPPAPPRTGVTSQGPKLISYVSTHICIGGWQAGGGGPLPRTVMQWASAAPGQPRAIPPCKRGLSPHPTPRLSSEEKGPRKTEVGLSSMESPTLCS